MKRTLIIIAAVLMSMGAVAQSNTSKDNDPVMALYQKQKAEFEAANPEISKKMKDLETAYFAAKDNAKQDSISKAGQAIFVEYEKAQQKYIQDNPSTVYAASIIAPRISRMSLDEIKGAYSKFSEEAKQSRWGKQIFNEFTALDNIQPGKPAPIIAKNDIDGKPFSLADLKGKVVILDFWASWCVPCRKSNPHMMSLYDKYHKAGLDFVYVGDDDSRPEALRQAIEKDGVGREGIHHLLRGLKIVKDENGRTKDFDRSEDVSELYAIHSLPTKYLIGKDGNIIGKVESDEWLDEQLSKLLPAE